MVNGINVIIGENGSGKSLLLNSLYKDLKSSWEKILIKANEIEFIRSIDLSQIKYIPQSKIINDFRGGELFSDEDVDYPQIDDTTFRNQIRGYTDTLKNLIQLKIEDRKERDKLNNISFTFFDDMEKGKNYYIDFSKDFSFTEKNVYEDPRTEINKLSEQINNIIKNPFFYDQIKIFEEMKIQIDHIFTQINDNWLDVELEIKVKNLITEQGEIYNRSISSELTTFDKNQRDYRETKNLFIEYIVNAIVANIKEMNKPKLNSLKKINGTKANRVHGFNFVVTKPYHDKEELEDLFSFLFVKDYQNLEKLFKIETSEEFKNAIHGCSQVENIGKKWNENIDKFIARETQEKKSILNGSNFGIGNTLGELSLSFYEYYTDLSSGWSVFLVDQPEDNISNSKISNGLITLFGKMRDKRQIIFVTHNPLLVVNLDVDNVIFLEKNTDSDIINVQSGCLEYEDDHTNILNIIANNMDGGRETIEKRLKVYGKDN